MRRRLGSAWRQRAHVLDAEAALDEDINTYRTPSARATRAPWRRTDG